MKELETLPEMDTLTCETVHRMTHPSSKIAMAIFPTFLIIIAEGVSFSLAITGDAQDSDAIPMAGGMGLMRESTGGCHESLMHHGEIIVPADYNIHELPSFQNETALAVKCWVAITEVTDINTINEEITLDLILSCGWTDTRLARNETNDYEFLFNPNRPTKIWHPDLFIENAKRIDQPALVARPMSLSVNSSGWAELHGRWIVTISCKMDFYYYPADPQLCAFNLESFTYAYFAYPEILKISWYEKNGSAFFLGDHPNFDAKLVNTGERTISGAGIKFAISLRRRLSYHLIQTYLPSSLFVFISWLTFLIPRKSMPERLAGCMTTLLTLTAMFAAVRQSSPRVSYVKALDIWMIMCMIDVFLTLLAHTLIYKLISMRSEANEGFRIQCAMCKEAGTEEETEALSKKRQVDWKESRPRSPSNQNEDTKPDEILSECGSLVDIFESRANKLECWTSITLPALFFIFNFIYWPWLLVGRNRSTTPEPT